MKTTAYLRISTIDQDIEKNKSDILKLANEKHLGHVEFVEEQISGKVSWKKRKIYPIIQDAQKDDVLIVSELSRLGRSMLEIMEILSIATEKQIKIYSVKGNWHLDGWLFLNKQGKSPMVLRNGLKPLFSLKQALIFHLQATKLILET